MKIALLISVVISLATFCAPTTRAEVTGTVQGRIRTTDNRVVRPNNAAGVAGGFVGVGRVVVAVTAVGQNNVINQTRFAVTNNNGDFTAAWRDTSRNGFPVPLRITVMWELSNAAGGGLTAPAAQFRIVRFGVTSGSEQSIVNRNVNGANVNLGNINIAASDETAAYLTTREVFNRIVAFSNVLQTRMPGLVVRTRVPGFNFRFGVAPFPREVFVSEITPVTAPSVVAHEIGHAINWSALGVASAPINPVTDYAHPGGTLTGWAPTSREFSKAAFQEGLADVWALEWEFGSDVNATFTLGGETFNFEAETVTNATTGAMILDCDVVANAHEFPFCNTAAVRDLLDNDGNGGDGVDLTRAFIVNTLDRFAAGIGNGQRGELGLDGLNHHDFRCNAAGATTRANIRAVWQGVRINGGPASFCAP